MMTTLICSKCGEAVIVTSRSVVLPFVCDNHEEETMAKKSSKCGTASQQPVPEADGVSNDMLLDMAEQLKTAREDLAAALDAKEFTNKLMNAISETAANQKEQIEKQAAAMVSDAAIISNLSAQVEKLDKDKFALGKSVASLIGTVFELTRAVEVRNQAGELVCKELNEARASVKVLEQRLKTNAEFDRSDVKYWRERALKDDAECYRLIHKVADLEGRGFWARVWPKK